MAITDVEFVMMEGRAERFGEPVLVPAGIALRTKEDRALVVVHPMDLPSEGGKMNADFGADQAGRTGNEEGHGRGENAEKLKLGKAEKGKR